MMAWISAVLRGVATMMDLSGSLARDRLDEINAGYDDGPAGDWQRLGDDWRRVGDDLRGAMDSTDEITLTSDATCVILTHSD